MKRQPSTQLVVIASVLVMAGCGAAGGTSAVPRVASLDANGEATWTQALSLPPSDPSTQCPAGLVNDESRHCVPHEIDAPHDAVYADFPDRMARIGGASFDLDITETTVDAYARCVAAGACTEPARVRESLESRCNWGMHDKGTHPVNCVSFTQAKTYCAWAGKRLPTDAEWAMAATGVDGDRRYPWGDRPARRGHTDVCFGEDLGTCAVGSHAFDVTPDGVMDMGGNVSEWVDGPTEYRPEPGIPSAPNQQVRGGNWWNGSTWVDAARGATVYWRTASERHDHVMGFRCARDTRT